MSHSNTRSRFRLDIRKSGQIPLKIDVKSNISVGGDPRNDIVLVGKKSLPHHLIFELKGENLSLTNLGSNNQTLLNSVSLETNKSYLIDIGDHVQISELEIIICEIDHEDYQEDDQSDYETINEELLYENESPPPHLPFVNLPPPKKVTVVFQSADVLTPEGDEERIIYANNSTDSKKIIASQAYTVKPKKSFSSHLSLLLVKGYALMTDFLLTFFLISYIVPQFDKYDLYFTIHQGFLKVLAPYYTFTLMPFFVSFYFLRLIQIIILGSTFGQFLTGLRFPSQKSILRMIARRFIVVFLGIFLYPAQNQVSQHFFFSSLRKLGLVILFGFIFVAPLFMTSDLVIDLKKPQSIKPQDIQTESHTSYDNKNSLFLKLEIPKRYALYPYAKGNPEITEQGFELFDLEDNKSLKILESAQITYEEIEQRLIFSNPFYHFHQRNSLESLPLIQKKELLINILKNSLKESEIQLREFGLFFSGQILAKNYLLKKVHIKSEVQMTSFKKEDPFFFLESDKNSYTIVFLKDQLVVFSMEKMKDNASLIDFANEQIMNRWALGNAPKDSENLGILEVLSALKREDEQSVLTYYINSAKKNLENKNIYKEEDLSHKKTKALISNIESLLGIVKNRNTKTSLEEIKHQLIPMENPGELK